MTACSTALSQDDIAFEIVQQLADEAFPTDPARKGNYGYWELGYFPRGDASDYTKALARLARTCRMFSEPALDKLWSVPAGGIYTFLGLFSAFRVELVKARARLNQHRRYVSVGQ